MAFLKDKYCIVGVGETSQAGSNVYTRSSGRTTRAMGAEALKRALEDAGMGPGDVDGMMSYHGGDSISSPVIATDMGMRLQFYMDCSGGGSSTEALVGLAMGAIEAGMCKAVALFRSMNGYTEVRIGGTGRSGTPVVSGPGLLGRAYGWGSPGQSFSPTFARHMMEYGTTNEQVAHVKVAHSKHASNNPKALMKSRVTVEEVVGSRWIVRPTLHLLDCCLETDNAVCIIIAPAEKARDLKQRPVYISGVQGRVSKPRADNHFQVAPITRVAGYYATPKIFEMSDVTHDDIGTTSCYDAFTWTTLLQFEAYGWCKPGEGGDYVSSGIIELEGGKRPNNTSGGHLCEGYTHGMNMVAETTRQLRGLVDDYCPNWQDGVHTYDYSEGHCRQIRDVEVAMNMGWASPATASCMITRR